MLKKANYTQIISSKSFIKGYKKANVRIRKAFDKQFGVFAKNPFDLSLNNHILHNDWEGFRSIDITSDWRAIYKELSEGKEKIAYFVTLGTHNKLYKNS